MKKQTQPPANFKGTRDILGDDMRWRLAVVDTIRYVFELFGFEPLETPVIEKKVTLTGKYGEEAENLLFYLGKPHDDAGLRYDHTVPLARVAAMNWQDLPKPYRRYSIGPVFRAENTQAGRYRQFVQCDFDTLGSKSLAVDAEIVAINYMVLTQLGFTDQFVVQMNDRRLLNAMAAEMGFSKPNQAVLLLRAWDKLDKTSLEEVFEYLAREMEKLGIGREKLMDTFMPVTRNLLATVELSPSEVVTQLRNTFKSPETIEAIGIVEELVNQVQSLGVPNQSYQLNPLLARGLGYYTGPIFETVVKEAGIGSITGGGRFDNLIEQMGGPSVPASGSSFGLDRLLAVMEKLGIRPESSQTTKVFVTIFDQSNQKLTSQSLQIARELRENGIPTEVYSGDPVKLGKQISLASKKQIPFVVVVGEEEFANQSANVKDMRPDGQQVTVKIADLPATIRQLL